MLPHDIGSALFGLDVHMPCKQCEIGSVNKSGEFFIQCDFQIFTTLTRKQKYFSIFPSNPYYWEHTSFLQLFIWEIFNTYWYTGHISHWIALLFVFTMQFGENPIICAACAGRRDLVEILLPHTKPIAYVPNWSVDGIIATTKSKSFNAKVHIQLAFSFGITYITEAQCLFHALEL